ncbi:MAG: hypothetical protein HUU20_11715 [Pirellulales bacterium]|nr:hypothetical protein [Pirellulales bacterium]
MLPSIAEAAGPVPPCRIEVVETGSGWPVPLVELRTTHHVRFVTDNAGVIAFDLPELMGQETWFDVIGHGYDVPKDGFGSRGVRLKPEPGKTLKVEVNRRILARRIGRLTGGGLFAESQKLGLEQDWRDAGILGCDSVQNAVHRGELFWLWGDSVVPRYPLGIFDGTSATTAPQPLASFQPPLRLKLKYITDEKGFPRGIAKMPGEGPTWVTGYVSLPDKAGKERLVGSYVKVKPPMEAYRWGLAVWNDETRNFEPLRVLWEMSEAIPKPPPLPEGHPVRWTDEHGQEWVLFGNPLPTLRCPATLEAWQDSSTWEALKPQETILAAGGREAVKPHSGSIAWNPWRKRWVSVLMQAFGKPSAFGEIWYAEADSPSGPWGLAVKVLGHENYTFYNPRLHPEFTPADSSVLFFEGTYTVQFSENHCPTPRYDYNQILYRLDLDDPGLAAAREHGPRAKDSLR